MQACLAGLGVTLLPIALAGEFVRHNQLRVTLEEYSSDVGGLYVIYPSKSHFSVTVRAFVDFVTTKAGDGLPWDSINELQD